MAAAAADIACTVFVEDADVDGAEAADAAAYESDVEVLVKSLCAGLAAAAIMDGGGAGGSSDRSCSESSGSERSSRGAEGGLWNECAEAACDGAGVCACGTAVAAVSDGVCALTCEDVCV